MSKSLGVICTFDPWNSPLCTCPPKYSFNPYTGCGHGCLYCYVNYIPKFGKPRRKKDLLKRVNSDLKKIEKNAIISISNSSDPYQPIEEKYGDFRTILEIMCDYPLKILIITKSDMVLRDIDILKELKCAVMITVTTLREDIAKKLEPFAPSPLARLKVLSKLAESGIPCGVRMDPIIPDLNDEEIEDIVRVSKEKGACHIVSSTYKAKRENFLRLKTVFPQIAEMLDKLYLRRGEKIGASLYAEKEFRRKIMGKVRATCDLFKITFSPCREGFYDLKNSRSCDGSHLIDQANPSMKESTFFPRTE